MIIFSPIRDIPVDILQYKGVRQVVKYNLSHYYAEMPTLNLLVPSSQFIPEDILNGDCSNTDFDREYHNFIFNNDIAFAQFMSIIIPVFMNPDTLVHITIIFNEYSNAFVESLIKLIQQRYGYNSYFINDIDDFIYTSDSEFSIPGLFMLDQDLARWRLMNNESIRGEEEYE